jgi:hypothetical protein
MLRVGPWALTAAVLGSWSCHAQAPAASSANRTVNLNYVYAANLGFGGYSLDGLTTNVYTLPLGYGFPVGPDGRWHLRLTLPLQAGLYQFRGTDTDGTRIKLDQQSLAVLPGFELSIPLTSNVTLTPFGDVGYGHAFGSGSGDSDSVIYTAGVRALTVWHAGQYTLSLGNAVLYAGDTTSDFHESYVAIETGFEVRRPLGFTVRGIEPDLGVYVAEYYYPKPLRFSRFLRDPLKVSNQGEVGFSVGSVKPLALPVLGSPRIGAGYVFGGGLAVWHVNFGFPF